MKKLLVTIAAVLVSVSAFAQGNLGSINLKNNGILDANGATYNAPIGNSVGATAQLYVSQGGSLVAVPGTTTFRTGAAAGFLSAIVVDVPGTTPGGSGSFVLRAWQGADWASATVKGESAAFTVTGLGGTPTGAPPITPPNLNGLQAFALTGVPEPSTIALGALGAAALLLRRRK